MIGADTEAEILRLHHAEKWPVGTIAEQLGVHHTTVQRVLQQTGVEAKLVVPRPSLVDPFVPFIVEQLEKYPRLCASRLFEMVKERGYPGGGDHFRRVVARHRPKKPAEAFHRLKTLPGEQAQVDWAHFGRLTVGRAERPLWAFVMVLSFSRQVFVRFSWAHPCPSFCVATSRRSTSSVASRGCSSTTTSRAPCSNGAAMRFASIRPCSPWRPTIGSNLAPSQWRAATRRVAWSGLSGTFATRFCGTHLRRSRRPQPPSARVVHNAGSRAPMARGQIPHGQRRLRGGKTAALGTSQGSLPGTRTG